MNKKKYIIVISGASGSIYAKHLIEYLSNLDLSLYLIISDTSKFIWKEELGGTFSTFLKIQEKKKAQIFLQNNKDLTSICASGSFRHDGMFVAPCSMKTLSSIAHGRSSNLIERTADVCIKEKFPIALLIRETPFSLIHIENMRKACLAGVNIVPAIPAFYHKDCTFEGLINFVIGKLLDNLGINNQLYTRWKEES